MIEIRQINKSISLGLINLEDLKQLHPLFSKRELEKKGVERVLEALKLNATELKYNQDNKPYLSKGKPFISITHSFNYLAVITNFERPTGIDIELKRAKIISIQTRFCNDLELQFADNDVDKLTCLWCAKETVFKIKGQKGINFKQDILVNPFNISDGLIVASLTLNGVKTSYQLVLQSIQNYYLTFLLNEI